MLEAVKLFFKIVCLNIVSFVNINVSKVHLSMYVFNVPVVILFVVRVLWVVYYKSRK